MHLIGFSSVLVGRIDHRGVNWGIRGSLRVSQIGSIGRNNDLRALGRGESAGKGLIAASEGSPTRPQSCGERPRVVYPHSHGDEGGDAMSMDNDELMLSK